MLYESCMSETNPALVADMICHRIFRYDIIFLHSARSPLTGWCKYNAANALISSCSKPTKVQCWRYEITAPLFLWCRLFPVYKTTTMLQSHRRLMHVVYQSMETNKINGINHFIWSQHHAQESFRKYCQTCLVRYSNVQGSSDTKPGNSLQRLLVTSRVNIIAIRRY